MYIYCIHVFVGISTSTFPLPSLSLRSFPACSLMRTSSPDPRFPHGTHLSVRKACDAASETAPPLRKTGCTSGASSPTGAAPTCAPSRQKVAEAEEQKGCISTIQLHRDGRVTQADVRDMKAAEAVEHEGHRSTSTVEAAESEQRQGRRCICVRHCQSSSRDNSTCAPSRTC
jgi:hypothetical protein